MAIMFSYFLFHFNAILIVQKLQYVLNVLGKTSDKYFIVG